jgi:hypothetical protein
MYVIGEFRDWVVTMVTGDDIVSTFHDTPDNDHNNHDNDKNWYNDDYRHNPTSQTFAEAASV